MLISFIVEIFMVLRLLWENVPLSSKTCFAFIFITVICETCHKHWHAPSLIKIQSCCHITILKINHFCVGCKAKWHVGITLSSLCLAVCLSGSYTFFAVTHRAIFRRLHMHSFECCHSGLIISRHYNKFLAGCLNPKKGVYKKCLHIPAFSIQYPVLLCVLVCM